jgi:type VI protein secretion system component Hcp
VAKNGEKPIGKLKKAKKLSLGAAAKPQKRVEMKGISFTRTVDKSSPVLFP